MTSATRTFVSSVTFGARPLQIWITCQIIDLAMAPWWDNSGTTVGWLFSSENENNSYGSHHCGDGNDKPHRIHACILHDNVCHYLDMSIFTILRDPHDARDHQALAIFNTDVPIISTYTTIPSLLPIRDQQQQGSCSAFAAAALKEYQENKEHSTFHEYMSPQFIYNCRPNYPAEGIYSRDLMAHLTEIGVVTEKTYPYGKVEKLSRETAPDLFTQAANYKITAYARITTIDDAKRALVKNGPLHISFPVYNYTESFWRGVGPGLGGHAVAIVGYDITGFILRNSWGMSYGKNGYGTFPYSDWGMHWDVWACYDASSIEIPTVVEPPKKCACIML